ncbi:MAG: phosphoenolpyruvate--protein phosphotransferase [Infirmifilum sp.]
MKIIVRGIPIVPGFAIGVAKIVSGSDLGAISSECRDSKEREEIEKINNSLEIFKNKVNNYLKQIKYDREINEINDLINTHILIAESIAEEAIELIKTNKICSVQAIKIIVDKYVNKLKESKSSLIGMRADDVIDVGSQLIYILLNKPLIYDLFNNIKSEDFILITNDILPSTVLLLAKSGLAGLVTKHGGITSHSAILLRTFNIPYIIASSIDLDHINTIINNKIVAIDGYKGTFLLAESDEDIRSLIQIKEQIKNITNKFFNERKELSITIDGYIIKILANVNNLEDARVVLDYGGDGIGLLRLEFMYMNRTRPPSEDELLNTLQKIAEFVNKKEVIIRALDAGGDKPIPYLNIGKENNPFLGLRGIRLLLKEHQDILIDEIRAVLRASNFGEFGFMIPMVSTLTEIIETKKIIEEIKEDFERQGIKYGKVHFGIMVETPSIALIMDKVVDYVDFISIGTNDLTQYVLAADRDNEKVQYLYNEFHPSVLRLLYNVVTIATQHNVRVDVCGEMASNELAIPILLSLGVNVLSVNIPSIPKIKYIVRRLNINKIKNDIINYLNNFNNENSLKDLSTEILAKTVTELAPLMKVYESYATPQRF